MFKRNFGGKIKNTEEFRVIYVVYFLYLFYIFCLLTIILTLINIGTITYIDRYNNEVKSLGLVSEFDYEGQYKHLFVEDKIYVDNPIIFNDEEYVAVNYQKILYQKHVKDDYEKKWNGRYWYEEKVKKEYCSWDLVKNDTWDSDKINFNILTFDKNILGKINFELISENIGNGIKEYYYGIKNNQEFVIYFKNYDNLKQDEIEVYNSYEEALEDKCLPKTCIIVCLNIILVLIDVLILYYFTVNYKEKALIELNAIHSDNQ